jgi:predicted dehydrogenase
MDRFGQELTWQAVVETATAQTSTLAPGPVPFQGAHPFTTALTEELEEFADCVRLNKRPEVGAAEGIAALRVIRAVMQSQQADQVIDIPLNDG